MDGSKAAGPDEVHSAIVKPLAAVLRKGSTHFLVHRWKEDGFCSLVDADSHICT